LVYDVIIAGAGPVGLFLAPTPGAAQRGPAGHFAGIQFDHGLIDAARWTYRLPGPSSMQLRVATEQLERVLATHAISVGVEIQRGHGLDGLEASDDEVTVHSGEERYRARFLVGCDGGRSTVRKRARAT
jgi:2-polyprenyl-6-methoxyphenol hydroxylase-like FAD-dependent oxidoreductase